MPFFTTAVGVTAAELTAEAVTVTVTVEAGEHVAEDALTTSSAKKKYVSVNRMTGKQCESNRPFDPP